MLQGWDCVGGGRGERTAFTGRARVGEEEVGEKGFIENICLLLL